MNCRRPEEIPEPSCDAAFLLEKSRQIIVHADIEEEEEKEEDEE